METWRPVVGYDFYEVSSLGRVRSWHKEGRAGGKKLDKPQIMRQGVNANGYLRIGLYILRAETRRLVHQLVLEAFVGPRPKGLETRHLDGNHANNKLKNLKWGSSLENAADAIRHGTMVRGETHGMATLTEPQARKIIVSKETGKMLAKRYCVSISTIWRIKSGKRWKHLQPAVLTCPDRLS